MTVAFASPVFPERPCKEVVVKNVNGQLLRREESYTEALEEPEPPGLEKAEVLVLKPVHQAINSRKSAVETTKSSVATAPIAQNSPSALQRNIRAWCDATGLPTAITIRFKDRVFELHKFPLVSRSGYLKRLLKETKEVTLPSDVPGGPEIFELLVNFCYGSTILMEPANIAELCCTAEYFQMNEEYGRANLCERSELYLTQVALQSWEDTLVVLLHCESLIPFAEQLGIVRRCLDALAFMACMELLDPVARKTIPSKCGEIQCWSAEVQDSTHLQWWIQDLVALPPSLFVKLILALRRAGMQENYVGQVITAFADRWIFGWGAIDTVLVQKGIDKCWILEAQVKPDPSMLIESVVKLLPSERNVVPIGFLFALIRRGLACGLNDDCREQLETRIALQFEQASFHDLLLPSKKEKESSCVLKNEIESMERIINLFLTRFRGYDDAGTADIHMISLVANLWDDYLAEIAFDSSLTPARFADLVEKIPTYMRAVHDNVYKAIHSFLKAHSNTTQDERLTVCRTLNCQKLSQEVCTHAVQNDLMPLRMIVQAMFMQQLQTRTALTSHLDSASHSFREHPISHHSRSILPNSSNLCFPSASDSARHHKCELSQDSFRSLGSSFRDNDLYIDDLTCPTSEDFCVKRESSSIHILNGPSKVDYQATQSRLRNLEAELSRMRKALAESMVDQNPNSRRQNPGSSRHSENVRQASTAKTAAKPWSSIGSSTSLPHPGRSGQLVPKMATVHEGGMTTARKDCGPSGCMSQLKQVNRTSGLLAKTLQKLKFRSFGKSTSTIKQFTGPVISAPIVSADQRGSKEGSQVPERDEKFKPETEGQEQVNRTDSMPRQRASRVKPHHVRHNSMH